MAHSNYYDFINYCINSEKDDLDYFGVMQPTELLSSMGTYNCTYCTTTLRENLDGPILAQSLFDIHNNSLIFECKNDSVSINDNNVYILLNTTYHDHHGDFVSEWLYNTPDNNGTKISNVAAKTEFIINKDVGDRRISLLDTFDLQQICQSGNRFNIGIYINVIYNGVSYPLCISFNILQFIETIMYPSKAPQETGEYTINLTSKHIQKEGNKIIIPNFCMVPVSIYQEYDNVMPTYDDIYGPLAIRNDLLAIPDTSINSISPDTSNNFLIFRNNLGYQRNDSGCIYLPNMILPTRVYYTKLKDVPTINYDPGQFVRYIDLRGDSSSYIIYVDQ